jgi:ligand-binding sensor domain-containing protein
VWALAVHDGGLWAGTLEGLARVDGGGQRVGTLDVRALAVTGGRLWAGTYGEGVQRLEGRRLVAEAGGARFVAALGVGCMGGPDGLWVAKDAKTLESWRAVALGALGSGDVAAVASDGERVWIGSFDHGLFVVEAGQVRAVEDPALDMRVNALAIEHLRGGAGGKGGVRVWVGTARGLSVIEPDGRVRRIGAGDGLPSTDVHALAVLRSGGVVAGIARGAVRVGLTGDRVSIEAIGAKQGLPVDAVWAVAEGAAGELWLGTSRGLYLWQGRRGKRVRWQRFAVGTGQLADDWVTALAVQGDQVFVGSYAHGVVRLEVAPAAVAPAKPAVGGRVATMLGGAPHVNFGGITLARGQLMVATMEGLETMPLAGGAWRARPELSLGMDVTGVVVAGDALWIAGRRGLVRAHD